jgi:hypothetical protein
MFILITEMADTCRHCGSQPDLPYRCQYCDGTYCPDHRLPEGHDCDGVRFLSTGNKRFKSKFNDEVITHDDIINDPEPLDPDYTVGSTPEPEYAPAPDTEIIKGSEDETEDDQTESQNSGLFSRIMNWL